MTRNFKSFYTNIYKRLSKYNIIEKKAIIL